MTKEELLTFDVFFPVKMEFALKIFEVFGQSYQYDFPKWCEENGIECYYYSRTKIYVFYEKRSLIKQCPIRS
jgi:hypothetical protein